MKRTRIPSALALAALVGLAACADTTSTPVSTASTLLDEDLVTNDVAVAAAEAVISDIAELSANEAFAGMPGVTAPSGLYTAPRDLSVSRTRTCYDEFGVAQAQCDHQTTASIVFTFTLDGSFARSSEGPRGIDSLSVAVHRARTTTVSGLLGTETQRIHDGEGSSSDTTRLVGLHEHVTLVRDAVMASLDSVQHVVFAVPRFANPFPLEGTLVKYVTGTVTLTVNDSTATRSFDRVVRVTFPPDAQGNVTMTITANGSTLTCLLNLVSHRVHSCQ